MAVGLGRGCAEDVLGPRIQIPEVNRGTAQLDVVYSLVVLNGPTVVHSNCNSPHDHPYSVELTSFITASTYAFGGAALVAGDVVPRGGCGTCVGGADDHHDRGLLSQDKPVLGVSEVQLPPRSLLEALDEGDRGRGVLDGHVALGAAVALRWERRIRRHRAAAHVRPRQHEAVIVDQAPDDGHGTGRWGA
eukprot:CAMPEP_0118818282 /NCGR_PEP_ID=MMETSP1162-20130426/6045_1 /TAXON_ID=33656 /ORGANISM="Phaeocystis Sp, Strain CCMP2710" /LENGTH=189 /DNA_ID=CAMNT_0006748471 /DNA_START=11 /DNA_END=580 /DNA_ORIENTATION=-